MAQQGYTRQSAGSIVTGGTILAAHFNNEYNQLVNTFDNTSGHRHDGTVTGGGATLVTASLTNLTNSSAGLLIADGANGFNTRTITGTAGTITVTNGTGASGNPTLTIDSTYIGQATITTLGTITTGTWTGTAIAVLNGGTGATTAANARTNLGLAIGSNVQAFDATLAALAAYNTNGLLVQTAADTFAGRTLTGTSGKITVTNGDGVSGNPTVTIDSTYTGQNTITTLGTIVTGVWNGTTLVGTYGGTGVNNGANTITIAGNISTASSFTTAGANPLTLTTTGSTNVTLPTTGTLITTTVATLSSLTSASSLATVGTITSGTWNGTIITSAFGGTGNGFTKFSGPATSEKTFTLPNASATVLTDNAAVTVAQGGTGLATLTANNVILGNGSSNPTFVAPSTSGNVLTSNGTTWTSATPTPHAIVLLSTQTASSSATIDFTSLISGTYNNYLVIFDNVIPATNSAVFALQTSTNNSSFDAGATDYLYVGTGLSTSAGSQNPSGGAGNTYMGMTVGVLNSGQGVSGTMWCYNLNNAAKNKMFTSDLAYQAAGSDYIRTSNVGVRVSTSAINALRFLFSSGSITSGVFKLYGIL